MPAVVTSFTRSPPVSFFTSLARALIAVAVAVSCVPSLAQDYPVKPIRIIVPFAAGGPADVYARFIGARLSESLGQPVVIDDRPGAGSIIGTDAVAKSAPDGYTLLMMSNTHTVNETLIPNKPYQLMRDFVPVATINYSDLVLVVHPSVGANSVAELIKIAKANPGKLNYASSGPGTPYHMAGELFKAMAGVDIVHIPYKGSSGARTDILGGQVQMMFDAVPTMAEHAKTGKVKALAPPGKTRSAVLAGRSHDRRSRRGGIRGGDLARPHGAERHSDRDRRQTERRDHEDPESSRSPPGVDRPGRAADGDDAGRVRPLSERRHRQVGADREDLRSEAGPVKPEQGRAVFGSCPPVPRRGSSHPPPRTFASTPACAFDGTYGAVGAIRERILVGRTLRRRHRHGRRSSRARSFGDTCSRHPPRRSATCAPASPSGPASRCRGSRIEPKLSGTLVGAAGLYFPDPSSRPPAFIS
jgi:tripartite-type tricarboxylate transporter receptor subunit TctC